MIVVDRCPKLLITFANSGLYCFRHAHLFEHIPPKHGIILIAIQQLSWRFDRKALAERIKRRALTPANLSCLALPVFRVSQTYWNNCTWSVICPQIRNVPQDANHNGRNADSNVTSGSEQKSQGCSLVLKFVTPEVWISCSQIPEQQCDMSSCFRWGQGRCESRALASDPPA